MAYGHVLAIVDGTRGGDRAVEVASDLAVEHRAQMTVATVIELEPSGRHCGPGPSSWNRVLRDAARADLARAERLVRAAAAYEILYGDQVEAVADAARELGCDVIVVPASSGLSRMLHRDRATRLTERVDCKVIAPQRAAAESSATLG